jgi:hypothetical protein
MMETVGRRWDRLVGLLFLAIVAVAVGLLIAGYGVAVGVGALAGLVLGFLAGALGALWLGRGSGRSITFGGMEWPSESGRPTAELMAGCRSSLRSAVLTSARSDRSFQCWRQPRPEG